MSHTITRQAALVGGSSPYPPAYTSQWCSACGFVDAGNLASQAMFRCLVCAHAEHAGANAAKNTF